MRLIRPAALDDVARRWPFAWENTAEEGALVFDLPADPPRFVCVFVRADAAAAAPHMAFDLGHGFEELTAISFRAFPFAFYHVALDAVGQGSNQARRLRLRVCKGRARFRCLVFATQRPVPVAILHYLFNLRYQSIGLVAPAPGGERGKRAFFRSNAARIRTFFSTVSAGGGVRVQQAEDDVLARLRLSQANLAVPVVAAMRARLGPAPAPLLSLVAPVYDARPEHLRDLVASFAAQDAPYAELVLVDDGSPAPATRAALTALAATPGVRLLTRPVNGGIAVATNDGIAAARGEWVSFIDHDDVFADGAAAVIAAAILDHPDAAFFYTDEVVTDATLKPTGSFCKPAYDPVLLTGMNYINHFAVYRRARLDALGGLAGDREGSQDYDLLLRYFAGVDGDRVVHIPFPAYVWRRGEGSYSAVFRERSVANARRALEGAVPGARAEAAATAPDLHRLRFPGGPRPAVTVIIPNRDSYALITRVVADLQERTAYPDLDIVVVDNGTKDPAVLAFYEAQQGTHFKADIMPAPFNFAAMCNRGARLARGDALLFLNNDVEVVEPDWLAELVECLGFPRTGLVGARLLYPSGRLQHAGVIVGLGEAAGHWHVDEPADTPGPMHRLAVRQTFGAVTAACMLAARACFEAAGGFDEAAFPVAYNDVDLCLRAKALGWRTVWTPFATLRHHESASRGSDGEGANLLRFRTEFARLQDRHGTATLIDEAFSPFYDRRYARPHLIAPAALPPPRRGAIP